MNNLERRCTMNKALYVTDNKTLIISPQDISSRKQYREEFSGKLYCPTAGCNAQLDYVELPYSGYEKIFRTHKGSEHNKSCPYCIIHKNSGGPTFSSETFSQAISENHIKSILKGLYQRNTNPKPYSAPSHTKSISKHRNGDSQSIIGRAIASIDPNAEPILSGEREPSVRKRRCQDLIYEDNNQLRGIDGIIDSANIGNDFVELLFSTNGNPVSLLFYNAFRDKSQQAYQYITKLAYMLNSSDLSILICCLGIVEVETNKTSIQIMAPDYITFEGLSIYNYITLKAS